jgi:hypothetical protein
MRLIRALGVSVFTLLGCLLIAVPPAAADTPSAFIERPLSLDPSVMQTSAAAMLVHNSAAAAGTSSNTEALEFGADYGVLHHLQVGAVLDLQVSPSTDFARGLVSGQYQFLMFAALRLDIGAERVAGNLDFAFGAGLPLRLKLTDTIALISGRPYAYGAEDDLFSVHAGSGATITELRVPVGILYQLDQHVALVGRSGIRNQSSGQDSATFIPLGADFTVTVSHLDLGVTFDIAGQVSPSASGYFDLLSVRGFAQLRLW